MKVTALAALVILMLGVSFSYAADKAGLGIDFYRHKDKVNSDSYSQDRDQDTNALRLYYEHLLKQVVGIQLELGYAHSSEDVNSHNSDTYSFDRDKIDLVGLLKYYFPLKGEASVYIGGGLGLTYIKDETNDTNDQEQETWVDLIEQAAIGVQFPLTENFHAFIEDRFLNQISDGHLRVGLYFNMPGL